jgi:plastocyanin
MKYNKNAALASIGSVLGILLFAFVIPVSTQAATYNVSITDSGYIPQNITVQPGDTVVWLNSGNTQHTVTSDNNMFNSGILSPGSTYSYTFSSVGTNQYYCTLHPTTMRGMVSLAGQMTNYPTSYQQNYPTSYQQNYPTNYQNYPTNYQNYPTNYQNYPTNYQQNYPTNYQNYPTNYQQNYPTNYQQNYPTNDSSYNSNYGYSGSYGMNNPSGNMMYSGSNNGYDMGYNNMSNMGYNNMSNMGYNNMNMGYGNMGYWPADINQLRVMMLRLILMSLYPELSGGMNNYMTGSSPYYMSSMR